MEYKNENWINLVQNGGQWLTTVKKTISFLGFTKGHKHVEQPSDHQLLKIVAPVC